MAYIDGFNLYYGLKQSGLRSCLWLDVRKLAQRLLLPGQSLVSVHYFTAVLRGQSSKQQRKQKRQQIYLEALGTISGIHIHYGVYQISSKRCWYCSKEYLIPKEKQSDVNLASELLLDAFADRFDCALVISGDGDLFRPVSAVPNVFPDKTVSVAFPPNRISEKLKAAASHWQVISHKKIKQSQLPNPVVTESGYELWRPTKWG